MSKVTVVGAGNVGATCANVLAFNEVADEVVMLDVKEGVSEGKAMDMMQTAQLLGFDTKVVGCTNDYEKTKGEHRHEKENYNLHPGRNDGLVRLLIRLLDRYFRFGFCVIRDPGHVIGRKFRYHTVDLLVFLAG